MLMLTRRPGEGINIGNDISITVLGVRGQRARLGVCPDLNNAPVEPVVLTEEESINIGNDIRVEITRIKGNQVRMGIEAPRNVLILRSELEKIDQ